MHPTRIFKSPEELLSAWLLYKSTLEEEAKKWPRIQYVGKDGQRVEDYPKLPLTIDDFEVFCYDNYGCVNQYFANKDGLYDDFVTLIARIRKECRADQIRGAFLKVYDQRITASLNGLKDYTQTEGNGGLPTKIEFVFSDMSGTPKEDQE